MPNVMVTLSNIGGALCSMPQSLADAHYLTVCAVKLPRRETDWNLQGCPKLVNRSKLLVGQSTPYCGDNWRTYCCLTSFFPIVDTCLSCEDIARQNCATVPRWQIFDHFFASCICSEPRVARFRPASKIRTKTTACVQVWQTSNLRRLRLAEETRNVGQCPMWWSPCRT